MVNLPMFRVGTRMTAASGRERQQLAPLEMFLKTNNNNNNNNNNNKSNNNNLTTKPHPMSYAI
jgi:hypothetical protein